MNQVEIKANEVIIKRNNLLIVLGVFALGIGITAVPMLTNFPKPGITGEYELSEVFGFLFGCFWLLVISGNGIYSITAGFNRIVIDSDGVMCKGLFGVKKQTWQEISDYGMFLSGRSMGHNEYILYFSRKVLPVNRKSTKKKLRGRAVFAYVYSRDEDIDKILAFCRRYSSVPPFISGEDKALNKG